MKELFVSYEVALSLKEKNFDEPCFGLFFEEKLCYENQYEVLGKYHNSEYGDGFPKTFIIKNSSFPYGIYNPYGKNKECIAAPLYQQVVDWFRDAYNLELSVTNSQNKIDNWKGNIINVILSDENNLDWDINISFKTYYEALNNTIKEAIKLI